MTRILVIGASRGIGREVTREAASRGHEVRAMSRSASTSTTRGASSVESFEGDAMVAGDIRAALDGVDVVVQALGVPVSLDLLTKPVTLFSKATRILLPEMAAADVPALVAITGFGAGDSQRAINPLHRIPFELTLRRAYDDKTRQENLIEESDLDWLIVRPGILISAPASRAPRVLTEPKDWRNGIVSRSAVATFIVDRIEAGHYAREKPVLICLPL
jgi:putative NADH-flavin reductase